MDEERTTYAYERYTITTLRDEGVWWAKARVAEKVDGADRPVLGGPWKSCVEAKTAADTKTKRKANPAFRQVSLRLGLILISFGW